jgi:hypothetical protein
MRFIPSFSAVRVVATSGSAAWFVRVACAAFATCAACAGCAANATSAAPIATCVPARASSDGSAAAAEVARVLDDWHDAAAKADEARYFAHFAPSGVFLGTDAKERWDVHAFRAYAHPFFAKGRAWSFHATARHVTFANGSADGRATDGVRDVAWFDETLATERLGPARGTGVLVRERSSDGYGGPWRIALYDLSIPIPNERFDDVKKLIDAPR